MEGDWFLETNLTFGSFQHLGTRRGEIVFVLNELPPLKDQIEFGICSQLKFRVEDNWFLETNLNLN